MSFYLMHRGWMEHPVFSNEPFTDREVWEWLIGEASFEPHKIRYKSQMFEVSRGEIPTSYRRLVDKFKWGIHRVRNFLGLLQQEGMITTKTATGFLIITICNYDIYQKPLRNTATQATTVATTLPATQATTNINKGKELKEGERKKDGGGSRLALTQLPEDWKAFCLKHRPDLHPQMVFELFSDHWRAKPGKDGSKLDWTATWRNWVRTQRQIPQSAQQKTYDNSSRMVL